MLGGAAVGALVGREALDFVTQLTQTVLVHFTCLDVAAEQLLNFPSTLR